MWPKTLASSKRSGSTTVAVKRSPTREFLLDNVSLMRIFRSVPTGTNGTTRFVLDFQRDLATSQGNELRAIVDYNKSLSNLARNKATTLERYNLQLQ